MRLKERLFVGVCGACLCGGVALTQRADVGIALGWFAIGFCLGALCDAVAHMISALLP